MANNTKEALGQSLKELLQNRTLDKITIINICEQCGVNRQTFYYYFKDIYDLIEYIFIEDARIYVGDNKTYFTWEEGFRCMFAYLKQNRKFVLNTYHSTNENYLERFLVDVSFELVRNVIEDLCVNVSISREDKTFIADFYKYAFSGMILKWISSEMNEDENYIIDRFCLVIKGNVIAAINRLKVRK